MSTQAVSTKSKNALQRNIALLVGALVLVGVAILLARLAPKPDTTPSAPNYYTGPMRNKRGDLVTEDGKILEYAKPGTPNRAVVPGD